MTYKPTIRWQDFVRSDLSELKGFAASKSSGPLKGLETVVKLDTNENPYGCSARVQKALAAFPYLNLYPDPEQVELRKLLEVYTGIGSEHIVATVGGEQLIELILLLLLERGDKVINCVPTFDAFRLKCGMYGGTVVNVPRDVNFAVDAEAVKAAIDNKTKIILLATPNNPTGMVTPRKDILDILSTGVPVLVDEAYYEFSGETVAPLVDQYQNMMVLRSFSKWAGLAGLRIGYGIFAPEIASYLLRIKPIYGVSAVATIAVRESLADIDYLMGNVKAIIAERERLFHELKKFKFLKPFPSRANFIFCHVLKGTATELCQALRSNGILVCSFNVPLLENSIRITVGKPEHTDALVRALREIPGLS